MAHDSQYNFDSIFLPLSFGSLGLSMQFSPKMGSVWPLGLILSWVAMGFSCMLGCFRHSRIPVFYNLNASYIAYSNAGKRSEARKIVKKLNFLGHKLLPVLFQLQLWLFFFGLIANLIFAGINYLTDINLI